MSTFVAPTVVGLVMGGTTPAATGVVPDVFGRWRPPTGEGAMGTVVVEKDVGSGRVSCSGPWRSSRPTRSYSRPTLGAAEPVRRRQQ